MKYKHDKNTFYSNEKPSWFERLLVKIFRVRLIPQRCDRWDLHTPELDEKKWKCVKCKGTGWLLYLRRFYLSPRWKWLSKFIFLHHILLSDNDKARHDHPAPFRSTILKGVYREICDLPGAPFDRHALESTAYPATHTHRLKLWAPVWTLVIWGKPIRIWGFHTKEGWVPWYKFLDLPPDSGYIEDEIR